MVMAVSAMLVAKIHFREFGAAGENILDCWPGGSAAYIGQIVT